MLQIVHDLAPGAKLDFATANLGEATFAQSPRTRGGGRPRVRRWVIKQRRHHG